MQLASLAVVDPIYDYVCVNLSPMSPKLLKTFPNEAISSLITRNALIFVIDFFNHR